MYVLMIVIGVVCVYVVDEFVCVMCGVVMLIGVGLQHYVLMYVVC